MPRPRQPRVVAIVGITLSAILLSAGPAVGAGVRLAPASATPSTAEHPAAERDLQVRGRVDVERIGRKAGPAPAIDGSDSSADGRDLAAESTTNSTTPPSLVPLPALSGGADPMVAVGPDHVVRSDDNRLIISDRSGGSPTVVGMADLFLLPDGASHTDGRIWFDARQQRWIAIETSRDCLAGGGATFGHGFLDIAISDGADPRAAWQVFFFSYDDARVSSPGLSTSTDKYVVTGFVRDLTTGCAMTGAGFWDLTSMDIPDMLGGGETDAAYFQFAPTATRVVEALTPVVQQPSGTSTVYVLARTLEVAAAERHEWLYRVTGSGGSTELSDQDDLTAAGTVAPWGSVQDIVQGASSFPPTDEPTAAAWRAGRLAYARTETCTPDGDTDPRSCVRVTELLVAAATPTRRQEFTLAQSGRDTYHPSLAYAIRGDLLVSYGRSAAGTPLGTAVVRQRPTDAVGSVSAPVGLLSGSAPFPGPASSWVGAAPDPLVPDAAWLTNTSGASGSPNIRTAQARTGVGATFKAITPLRVLDTRNGTGLSGAFVSGAPRTFQVAGVGAIPAAAIAVTANVTVTGQTAGGFVSITPTATATPTSSTLNFPTGDTRANNATVSLDTAGKLAAVFKSTTGRTAHVIVDVTGYFVADDDGATYKPLTPVRLLDTRVGNGAGSAFAVNVPRSIQITGRGGIPAGAVAITGNLTVTGQSRAGYVSVTPNPTATPTTSTLNFPTGDTRANGLTVPLNSSGRLAAVYKASAGTAHLILDVTGYYVAGTSGLRFFPLEPGRILDTRMTSLTLLTGKFTSSSARTLATGGHFGVPPTAQAVTGNLTVTGQSRAGYVSVTRTKTNSPTVSTINFPVGDTRANGITTPLDSGDDAHLVYKASSGATTHVILDLTGYFE